MTEINSLTLKKTWKKPESKSIQVKGGFLTTSTESTIGKNS